jgi:hypothetical protein
MDSSDHNSKPHVCFVDELVLEGVLEDVFGKLSRDWNKIMSEATLDYQV